MIQTGSPFNLIGFLFGLCLLVVGILLYSIFISGSTEDAEIQYRDPGEPDPPDEFGPSPRPSY